jgi:hypothetical protein
MGLKFSQRIGKTPVRETLQIGSMDQKLTNKLWNFLYKFLISFCTEFTTDRFFTLIWVDVMGYLVDEMHHDNLIIIDEIKGWFLSAKWYERYDLLEAISEHQKSNSTWLNFTINCNKVLKEEISGYRIVDSQVTPIISEQEIIEIESALNNTSKWESVNTHINRSLEFLSNREEPDFRNSLKESISSVEAMCEIILGKKNTLGAALTEIRKKYNLPNHLTQAFSKLYGHASNTGGARHNLSEEDSPITMEYARYMLISCSAFVNYLGAKSEKF